jgi:hypothetical protein
MHRNALRPLFLLLVLSACGGESEPAREFSARVSEGADAVPRDPPPDAITWNEDLAEPQAEALALRDERIAFVGHLIRKTTEVLEGRITTRNLFGVEATVAGPELPDTLTVWTAGGATDSVSFSPPHVPVFETDLRYVVFVQLSPDEEYVAAHVQDVFVVDPDARVFDYEGRAVTAVEDGEIRRVPPGERVGAVPAPVGERGRAFEIAPFQLEAGIEPMRLSDFVDAIEAAPQGGP